MGFALGGGEVRRFAHIGVVRALREASIPIDFVGGTSTGSIMAGEVELGWSLEEMLERKRFSRQPVQRRLHAAHSRSNHRRKIVRVLSDLFGDARIEDQWTGYLGISVNLTRGEMVVSRDGSFRECTRASSSSRSTRSPPSSPPPRRQNGRRSLAPGLLGNLERQGQNNLGGDIPRPRFQCFEPNNSLIQKALPNRNPASNPNPQLPNLIGIMSIRPVKRLIESTPTLEGAGVHLRRAFGFGNTSDFDPFLLLDDFRNDVPKDYTAGFPWHPHRGIETITYVLAGTVEHGDSMGNKGAIGAGDVQWMTAGSGIIHQEMPQGDSLGRMHGFQLWANLPASLKMTAPRYQEVKAGDIPVITENDGTAARIVCGSFWGQRGPVDGIAADPLYLDISVPPGRRKVLPVETTRHAFAYVFAGSGKFGNASGPMPVLTEEAGSERAPMREAGNRSLVLFDRGDEVTVEAGPEGIRFLLVSGQPLEEPVAWRGPIVMNTQEQLRTAFEELNRGTFLK